MHHDAAHGDATDSAPLPHGLWPTLRAAVRGIRIDYTTAPVGQAVIMPLVLPAQAGTIKA